MNQKYFNSRILLLNIAKYFTLVLLLFFYEVKTYIENESLIFSL